MNSIGTNAMTNAIGACPDSEHDEAERRDEGVDGRRRGETDDGRPQSPRVPAARPLPSLRSRWIGVVLPKSLIR
jgi:hypothetical protein